MSGVWGSAPTGLTRAGEAPIPIQAGLPLVARRQASHRYRRPLFATTHHVPQIDDSGRMMANAGAAIAHISGTVDRRHRACSFHHPTPFLRFSDSQARSSGSSSRPSGVIRRSPMRKPPQGPVKVNTVVRVELNHAAISSLAGVPGRRQEPSQSSAIAMWSQQRPDSTDTAFAQCIIPAAAGLAGALPVSPSC